MYFHFPATGAICHQSVPPTLLGFYLPTAAEVPARLRVPMSPAQEGLEQQQHPVLQPDLTVRSQPVWEPIEKAKQEHSWEYRAVGEDAARCE